MRNVDWSCFFGRVTWRIWKNRNIYIYIFQCFAWSVDEIVKDAYSWAKQLISSRKGGGFVRQVLREGMVETEGWIRLKTDRAVKINTKCTVVEVLRDHNGNWILEFNSRLRKYSIFEAELWGILDGVTLVQGRQHDMILVQTDNMKVIGATKEAF